MKSDSVFRLVFERSPAGMAILSVEGKVLRCNAALSTMLDSGELQDRFIGEILAPAQSAQWKAALEQVAANRYAQEELALECAMGERWVRLQISRLDSDGEQPQLHLLAQDATEEQHSRERLERAKETAEKATRTKSAFLANMSHEIRTPLHTITGITELLLDTQLDDEQAEYGRQIRFSADVLLGLINDILDFSKIEAGKLTLEYIEFDLMTMVEDAVDMVSLEAHKRGLEVVTFLSPELPDRVSGDPVRLRQIVVNLFNNATKFTAKGEIYLRVRPRIKNGRLHDLLFEVQDTGIGIPAEKRKRLFRAFSQVDDSTTRKFGGTGLGLSISKSLVHLMGGNIGVRSEENEGSTFWFTVPLGDTQESVTVRPTPFLEGKRVLVVDDNANSRKVIARYLNALGAEVSGAESGQDGLEKLKQSLAAHKAYDAILVDQEMHGMDGWHFASEVRANEDFQDSKLMLLSPAGKSYGEAKMKLLKWFQAYAGKPVKRRELSDALYAVLVAGDSLDPLEEIETLETVGELEELEEVGELESLDERITPSSTPRVTAEKTDNARYRVLIAEDHFVNQQLFQTILSKMGYTTMTASDGVEAVRAVTENGCDLIFMDVQMPNLNGYEATQRIREAGFSVPIVAVTANALKGERERCTEAGMNDYLTKPFKSHDLVPFLTRYLKTEQNASAQLVSDTQPDLPPQESIKAGLESGAQPVSEIQPALLPFDYEAAVAAFMGKSEVVKRVIGEFIRKVSSQLDLLHDELAAGNFSWVRTASHGIKGGAWNLEAKPLGDAAGALEDSSRAEDGEQSDKALKVLELAFAEFKSYCENLEELQLGKPSV
ncbi:MAG: response regulator [Spirochaetaceae bacterium]|nr:MAG: response regulator [Spirochaetaceae bacterium]